MGTAPAEAQTVTIAATGNCGGTPANCGTPTNRNGDRDTTWPGLQVDEGDQIAVVSTLSGVTGTFSVIVAQSGSGTAWNTSDLDIGSTAANNVSFVGNL